jgi:carbonic anhydrase
MAFAILPQQSPIDLGYANPIQFLFPDGSFVLQWGKHPTGTLIMDPPGGHGPEFRFSEPEGIGLDLQLPGQSEVTRFHIESLHFHSPCEHKVSGTEWPLELHIVHSRMEPDPFNPGQNRKVFVVLGVFLDEYKGAEKDRKPDNPFFERYIDKIEQARAKNLKHDPTPETIDPNDLLPDDKSRYWRYEGSLTTDIPAPNGGFVSWVIYKDVKHLAPKTFARYVRVFAHARKPIQDLDRRYVFFNQGRSAGSTVA